MQKIIKIESAPKHFCITWRIGSFCNYDCMYCPRELHDDYSKPHSLEKLKTAWKNIYNASKHHSLKYRIDFTGGEPTANKSFLPFLKWLKQEHGDDITIMVTSNGSASLDYYVRLSKFINGLGLSFHSEFANEKEFFEKSVKLHHSLAKLKKYFSVLIMDEYWNKERIEKYISFLTEHKIYYSLSPITYGYGVRDNPIMFGVQNIEEIRKS